MLVLGCGTASLRCRPALTVTVDELDRGIAALDRVAEPTLRMSTRTPSASPELRAAFATRMAAVYGREVPAYTTLVEVVARR